MRGEYRARLLLGKVRALAGKVGARIGKAVLPMLLSNPIQARLVGHMAWTGIGTDRVLKQHGALPLPVHFYSPVPDIEDLRSRDVWSRESELAGIDFSPERQIALLREMGDRYGAECDWPTQPAEDGGFYSENGSFSFGCAASTHCLIRSERPERVIEIGSGRSSQVIARALAMNEIDGSPPAHYAVIDPYPSPLLDSIVALKPEVVPEKVEVTSIKRFEALGASDVLFVDSGHVVRTGGDVNYLILDVLPRLKPGCIVHFHDIPLPFEYGEAYATNPAFRMLWTEAYLLQAFLSCNAEYEVLLGMAYLMKRHPEVMQEAFPHLDRSVPAATSGSFWIRRRQ